MTTSSSRPTADRGRAGGSGLTAGILFLSLIVVTTALEWGFMRDQWGWSPTDSRSIVPYPSGLSTGPLGFLQIANFAITGCLVLHFTIGLVGTLRRGVSRVLALVGLGLAGLSLVASAFPTDRFYRPTTSHNPVSWHGWIHTLAFVGVMAGLLIGTIAVTFAMRRSPAWQGWWLPTAAVPIGLLVGLFVVPAPWGFYLVLVVAFGWVSLTGARLRGAGTAETRAATSRARRAGAAAGSPPR